eukprot:1363560-Amorphochlora_amoeboformis.AAC.2
MARSGILALSVALNLALVAVLCLQFNSRQSGIFLSQLLDGEFSLNFGLNKRGGDGEIGEMVRIVRGRLKSNSCGMAIPSIVWNKHRKKKGLAE